MSRYLVVHFNAKEWEENVRLASEKHLSLAQLVVELLRKARSQRGRANEQSV